MSSPAETGESMVVEREFLVKVYVNKVKQFLKNMRIKKYSQEVGENVAPLCCSAQVQVLHQIMWNFYESLHSAVCQHVVYFQRVSVYPRKHTQKIQILSAFIISSKSFSERCSPSKLRKKNYRHGWKVRSQVECRPCVQSTSKDNAKRFLLILHHLPLRA